jgi:predicted porin
MSLSAVGSIGDFGVGLGYTDKDNIGSKVVLSGSYDFGDTTVTGFVANTDEDVAGSAGFVAGQSSDTEYGLGVTYSLGGATAAAGVSRNFQKNTMADLGIRFSF